MAVKKKLGTIQQITDLREIWGHEATDFTPWLAENIDLLNEATGLNLEVLETEAQVGSFSVDILAQDANSEQKAIIENQLEDTNHDHLGKLLTYAAGKDAKCMIWIVKNAREEHRAAIREHKKASFLYFDLNENKEKAYRRGGERYIVDPMALVYNEDFYYLMSFNSKHDAITTYRVDRMERVQVEDEQVCPQAIVEGADIHEYTSQVFKMYNGTPQEITLEFDDVLIGAVYDRFGEDITDLLLRAVFMIKQHFYESSLSATSR